MKIRYFKANIDLTATDCYKSIDDASYNYVWDTQHWVLVESHNIFKDNNFYTELSVITLYNMIRYEKENLGLKNELEVIIKKEFYEDVLNE